MHRWILRKPFVYVCDRPQGVEKLKKKQTVW